jgi:hypothetical protein
LNALRSAGSGSVKAFIGSVLLRAPLLQSLSLSNAAA